MPCKRSPWPTKQSPNLRGLLGLTNWPPSDPPSWPSPSPQRGVAPALLQQPALSGSSASSYFLLCLGCFHSRDSKVTYRTRPSLCLLYGDVPMPRPQPHGHLSVHGPGSGCSLHTPRATHSSSLSMYLSPPQTTSPLSPGQ